MQSSDWALSIDCLGPGAKLKSLECVSLEKELSLRVCLWFSEVVNPLVGRFSTPGMLSLWLNLHWLSSLEAPSRIRCILGSRSMMKWWNDEMIPLIIALEIFGLLKRERWATETVENRLENVRKGYNLQPSTHIDTLHDWRYCRVMGWAEKVLLVVEW